MALNGVHPESSSLPSTFVPAERSGVDDDWTELRDQQQRPHSSYNPSEEQKRRSITENGPDQSQNMQVLVNAAGSSTEGLSSNNTHQNGGVNRIGEISEETEPAPKPIVKKKKRKLLLYLAGKIAGLLILSIVIAGLFSIPVALFALKPNDSSMEDGCRGEIYSGEICQSVLAARQSCIPGRERSSDILVALPESQHAIAEQELAQLLLLPTSRQCGDELLQFLCLEAFSGFCDPSGTVQRTSRQECERITTVTCAAEFQLILPTLQSRGISVSCDSFLQNSSACNTDTQFGSGIAPPQAAIPPAIPGSDSSTEDGCRGEIYSGEICQSVLAARQSCIPGRERSSDILVALPESQHAIAEQELAQLLLLPTSPQCGDELLQFFCLEAFSGFCDPSGTVQRTSRQECERITTVTCAAEFQLILLTLQSRGISVSCDSFPQNSSACNTDTQFGSGTENIAPPPAAIPVSPAIPGSVTRNCSDGFFVNEASDLRLCTPECGEWWPQSPSQLRAFNIINLTAGAVGFTLCLAVVILSCIYHKTTFQFPGIFIFYQMLSSLVYIAIFLLNYVDFKGLFCESRDLVESLMPGNETPFCIITAASWIYISSQVALWWIFHLSMIFWAVFWPFKYHYWRQSGYLKYIHLLMVLVALVVPVIPVIICLKLDGYVFYTLIQPMCVARNSEVAFYSHVLPLIAVVAVGLYLLILIFWKFFSEECRISKRRDSKRQVEVKILLLLLCYIVVWTDAIGVTVATLIEAQDYRNTLVEYFTCEASGTEDCPRGTFEQFDVVSKLIASFLIGLYPGIFLIYFFRLCKCRRSLDSSISGGSESVLSRNV